MEARTIQNALEIDPQIDVEKWLSTNLSKGFPEARANSGVRFLEPSWLEKMPQERMLAQFWIPNQLKPIHKSMSKAY